MIAATLKKHLTRGALSALVGFGMSGLAFSTAYAGGDIGGNCCADLEERVAELEATTARKGNRKVSLTVSGQVNKALMYINDGNDHDLFVVDNINSSSRFRFVGSAKIRPGWSAGYLIEIELDSAESAVVSLAAGDNDNDDGNGTNDALDIRHAVWWIKSDRWGKISVGQTGHATWGIDGLDLSGTSVVATVAKADVGGGVQFRTAAGALSGVTIGDVAVQYTQFRGDVVKFESTWFGFLHLSSSYGEDDVSDTAVRIATTVRDFQIQAGIGYANNEDEGNDFTQVAGSFSALHKPTGLNLTVAGGDRDDDANPTLDQRYWYVKAGLKRKFRSSGATAISFDYYDQDEHAAAGGEFTQWGVQVVQFIDAAAMELYASYSNSSYDTTAEDYQDIDLALVGARIKF